MLLDGNIIIHGGRNTYKDDRVLLCAFWNGYYYYYGAIHTIIKGYNNKEIIHGKEPNLDEKDLQDCLNDIRSNIFYAASSIILASKGTYVPASSFGHKEYDEKGNFYNCNYKYIIEILDKYDRNGDIVWRITFSDLTNKTRIEPITRTIKEWHIWNNANVTLMPLLFSGPFEFFECDPKNVSKDIAESIHFNEIETDILKNIYKNIGPCPCDICAIRPMCIQINKSREKMRIRRIREKCKQKSDYENVCLEYFLGKFDHDSMLQELLKIAFTSD